MEAGRWPISHIQDLVAMRANIHDAMVRARKITLAPDAHLEELDGSSTRSAEFRVHWVQTSPLRHLKVNGLALVALWKVEIENTDDLYQKFLLGSQGNWWCSTAKKGIISVQVYLLYMVVTGAVLVVTIFIHRVSPYYGSAHDVTCDIKLCILQQFCFISILIRITVKYLSTDSGKYILINISLVKYLQYLLIFIFCIFVSSYLANNKMVWGV